MMRRRFLPFFPFPKPLPLLDIPDPRYIRLAATSDTQPCGKSSLVCSIRRWRGLLVRLVRSAPTMFDGIGGSNYDAAPRTYSGGPYANYSKSAAFGFPPRRFGRW